MKQLCILFYVLFISLVIQAQLNDKKDLLNSKTVLNAASLNQSDGGEDLILKEKIYDFGKIPQGKPVTHIFEVVNNGKDSLKIVNVQASCGCTTPDWDKNKVQAPTEKTVITVGYNAASEGPFTKTITITYNGTKTKQFDIKGVVWKTPVTSAPENTALTNLKD